MISKSMNRKRLAGSQLGYRGKGVPDPETMSALQIEYCNAIVAGGGLPSAVRSKLERVRTLTEKALRGEERVREVARMLAGTDVTDESRALAEQLLQNSTQDPTIVDFSR